MSTDSEPDGITSMHRRSLISELAALAAAEARSTEQLRIGNGYEMFVNSGRTKLEKGRGATAALRVCVVTSGLRQVQVCDCPGDFRAYQD